MSPLLTPAPVPLIEGEALFSLLGRWLHRTGAPEAREFVKAVTKGPGRTISLSFPSGFGWLRKAHPGMAAMGLEALVMRYTAAPLYRPFLEPLAWSRLQTILAGAGSRQARMLLGVARSGGDVLKPMHCPACMEEQLVNLGHVYWPVRFTLPYVTACPKHGLRLQEVRPSSCIRLGKAKYLGFPSEDTVRTISRLPADAIQVRLSTLAVDLAAAQLEPVTPSALVQAYLHGLKAKGLAEPSGRVRRQALWGTFNEQWRGLSELRLGAGRAFPAWLNQLYAPAGPSVRCPVYHLLLVGLLFGSVDAWRETLSNFGGIGRQTPAISPRTSAYQAPVTGTKFVQLRHWLERSGPDDPRLTAGVIELLSSGLPMHEVVAASGLSRHQLYRALRRSPQLARARALAALAVESLRRTGAPFHFGSSKTRPAQAGSKADKKWVYRHGLALEVLGLEGANNRA